MINQDLQQVREYVCNNFTPAQIAFSQAVSVCSVMIEMGLQRASIEDITDGLEQRFQGMMERNHIQDVASHAINFGLEFGLFESVDVETITLSTSGIFVGRDWLCKMRQEAA
jgi:hypothetical protein